MGQMDLLELEKDQRGRNALRITLTLTVLKGVGLFTGLLFTMQPSAWGILFATSAAHGLAYGLVRSHRVQPGVFLCIGALLAEFVSLVTASPLLGPLPYLTSLVVLIAAATLGRRQLPVALGGALLAIAAQAFLAPGGVENHAAVMSSVGFSFMVFVVSWLHVSGTRRAFEVAIQLEVERAAAVAQALRSEERYRLIADNTSDFISLSDTKGRARYLSPSHKKLLGRDPEECLGMSLTSLLKVQNTDAARANWRQVLEEGEANLAIELMQPDGSVLVIDSSFTRVQSAEGPLIAAIGRDITEHRKLQQEILSSERTRSLGQLAGGVAHDFNNLLTVIWGTVELATEVIPPDHDAQEDLAAALKAAEAAKRLTHQLLTFSKRQLVIEEDLDVAQELNALLPLLRAMAGNRVKVSIDTPVELSHVRMSNSHFEQLVMNLVVNARDAMPDGGRVVVGVREPGGGSAGESQWLELWVQDEGEGIPASALPHLFEPFFSTKGEAGTGLGLATCASIVERLGGSIRVDPELTKGTCFRALLPTAIASDLPQRTASLGALPSQVLVVDDESAVRRTTRRMLESLDCQVHSAATLTEARAILADRRISLDALLTDSVLSNERGTDLLDKCREGRPQLKLVVMSGFSPEKNAREVLLRNGAVFLSKPFTKQQLIDALRKPSTLPAQAS